MTGAQRQEIRRLKDALVVAQNQVFEARQREEAASKRYEDYLDSLVDVVRIVPDVVREDEEYERVNR
jgi:hypothetical protein